MTKIKVEFLKMTTQNEIPNYWNLQNYKELLSLFNFDDIQSVKDENLIEYLKMSIAETEPNEAAEILLTYQLSESLSPGQIKQISNDMLIDKVCEEYPEIDLHFPLYQINQFLYHAYNGKFPNCQCTFLEMSLIPEDGQNIPMDSEQFLRIIAHGLKESAIIQRLYSEKLEDPVLDFPDGSHVLWKIVPHDGFKYTVITSEYWLSRDDFNLNSFECEIPIIEKHT